MASETGSTSTGAAASSAAAVIARQDRIPTWALSYLFIGIIGIGFLFTFYDIFDITVSFIQTCTQIVLQCVPGGPPGSVMAGYVVGALILTPLADRFGRRDMLLFTLLLTGLGSLYTVFVGDYTNFIIARVITGIGIGADLAIVNTAIQVAIEVIVWHQGLQRYGDKREKSRSLPAHHRSSPSPGRMGLLYYHAIIFSTAWEIVQQGGTIGAFLRWPRAIFSCTI